MQYTRIEDEKEADEAWTWVSMKCYRNYVNLSSRMYHLFLSNGFAIVVGYSR